MNQEQNLEHWCWNFVIKASDGMMIVVFVIPNEASEESVRKRKADFNYSRESEFMVS
jgi:hypothetical protein